VWLECVSRLHVRQQLLGCVSTTCVRPGWGRMQLITALTLVYFVQFWAGFFVWHHLRCIGYGCCCNGQRDVTCSCY
jgi:hypothetical protein